MGSGKSSVGSVLAERLNLPFVDLDAMVEVRTVASIADLFRVHGELWFRNLEAELLAEVLQGPTSVVALGGGTIVDDANWACVRAMSVSVWLDCPPDVLFERIGAADDRPLLAGHDGLARLQELLAQRGQRYAESDLRVDANRSRVEVVEAIVRKLGR